MGDYDIESPVLPLKDGIQVNQILENRNLEFEVIPDEDDEEIVRGTSAESCFDFEAMKQHVNLDVIDVNDDDEGCEDATPFDKYRRKMHNILDNGLVKKYVIHQGSGPLVPENSVVYLRYQAYVEYQEVPFDSTLMQCEAKRDDAMPFNLGCGQLLPGLHTGVLSMRKGEKAEFLVHYKLAYGKLGCPPRIPPEATVLFVVELERFVDCGDIHINEDAMDMEERKQFVHVNRKAKGHHLLGKDYFLKDNYSQAANKFKVAINMLHNSRLASEEEEKERNHFLLKLYSNSCVCYHNMKLYKKVCIMAADAMRVNPTETLKHIKIQYYWGYAKMMLADYEGARKHLLAANRINPKSKEIQDALALLEHKQQKAKQEEKLMYQRCFTFKPPPRVEITEVDEEEEEQRSSIRKHLMEFKENDEVDSLLLKEQYTRAEEELWIKTAKSLGLYARAVDSNPRVIDIQKPRQ